MLAISFFQELLGIIMTPALLLLGYLFPLTSLNPSPAKKVKIVFVHGWLGQNISHFFFKKALEKRGYQVYMTNFGLLLGDINQSITKLQKYMDSHSIRNVVLVGASEGAIISYLYLEKYGGWSRVARFISIAGPFRGTPMGYLAFFSKATRQLIPGSQFLSQLPLKPRYPKRITNIRAKYDQCVPSFSSQLPGAKNIEVNGFGHVWLQALSTKVIDIIDAVSSKVA